MCQDESEAPEPRGFNPTMEAASRPFQFSLTHIFMGTWLLAILLSFPYMEGCGRRITRVSELAFSPDGRHLAVVRLTARSHFVPLFPYLTDLSRTVSTVDVSKGCVDRVIEQEKQDDKGGVHSFESRTGRKMVAYGHEGKTLLVNGFGNRMSGQATIRTYRCDTGERSDLPLGKVSLAELQYAPISDFAVTPDGSHLVAAVSRSCFCWNLASHQAAVLSKLALPKDLLAFSSLGISPDGKRVALGMVLPSEVVVEILDASDGSPVTSLEPSCCSEWDERPSAVEPSPDGKHLAVWAPQYLRVYNWKGRLERELFHLLDSGNGVKPMAFSSDSKALAFVREGKVSVVDVASGRTLHQLQPENEITSLAYSPSGDLLAMGDNAGAVQFWNSKTGNLVRTVEVPCTVGVLWFWPVVMLLLWLYVCRQIYRARAAKHGGGGGNVKPQPAEQ